MRIDSAQALNLAAQHNQAGNLLEAQKLCLQILQDEPGHVEAQYLLGVIDNRMGRHEHAVQRMRSVVRVRPNFSEAHTILGLALHATGKPEEGVVCLRQAVRLKPNSPEAHNNLGNALHLQGKHAEALASLQQAVRLRPGYVGALLNLGIVLHKLGRLDEAAMCYQQILRLVPNHAEAHNNLGGVLQEQGKLDEAAASIRQALVYKPDHAHAHYNLGCVLLLQEKLVEAAASFEQAIRFMPNHVQAHSNLGKCLHNQGKFDKAKAIYERTLRLQPDFPIARCNLGTLLQHLGDFTGAEREYRTVLRDHPRHADALWPMARMLRRKMPDADRIALEECLAKPDLGDIDRARILFGLSTVCDAKGEYDKAAAQMRQANALMVAVYGKKGQGYNRSEHERFMESVVAAFAPAFFERVRGFGLESERPVFIVGLPRSGTTLIEQILAAHSQVFGAGELQLASQDYAALETQPAGQSVFATPSGLESDAVRRVAQRHLDQLANLNSTAARVVDKMPENYVFLGLLATLFPRAKFIHCRRDLRDVAVSCWMTNFVELSWSSSLDHIVSRFRGYCRLMQHWRAVPVDLLEVKYEETVADLPSTARRLLEWCGLDWEPACLNFHESHRPVRTASVLEARQPINSRSVGRWRNYERELSDLFAALQPLLDQPA
jgi:tetratricopeptide (TPR) repeat protein